MEGLFYYDNFLEYVPRTLEKAGFNRYTKSFKIPLNDIVVIEIIAIVLLDDEDFIVTLIDKNKKEHKFSSLEFNSPAAKFLEEKFIVNLKSQWGNFTYQQHCTYSNKILYPPTLEGKRLYKRMFDSPLAFLFRLNIFSKPFEGIRTDEVIFYIEKHKMNNPLTEKNKISPPSH